MPEEKGNSGISTSLDNLPRWPLYDRVAVHLAEDAAVPSEYQQSALASGMHRLIRSSEILHASGHGRCFHVLAAHNCWIPDRPWHLPFTGSEDGTGSEFAHDYPRTFGICVPVPADDIREVDSWAVWKAILAASDEIGILDDRRAIGIWGRPGLEDLVRRARQLLDNRSGEN